MRQTWLHLCVGVLAVGAVAHVSPSPVRPADSEVVVHVSVTGRDGITPHPGLTRDDFEIRSDGLAVPIAGYSSEPGPLTAVVLLDATWTMASIIAPFRAEGRTPLRAREDLSTVVEGTSPPRHPVSLFLDPVRDGIIARLREGDRLRVGSISRHLRLTPAFAPKGRALDAAVFDVLQVPENDRYGPSPIWDAIDTATAALEAEPGQRAIVLVTDGMATGNRRGLHDVTRRATLSGTAIYVVREIVSIYLGHASNVDRTDNPWVILQSRFGDQVNVTMNRLAAATGGRYCEDGHVGRRELKRHLERVLNQLQHTHAIRFVPPQQDNGVHRLEVRVKIAGLSVRAPISYRAPVGVRWSRTSARQAPWALTSDFRPPQLS